MVESPEHYRREMIRMTEKIVDQHDIKFWHHQHLFKTYGDGTEMTDIVHYALGYGFLGNLITRFIVSPRLGTIFDYRYKKLTRLFSGTALVGETKNQHGVLCPSPRKVR